MDLEAKWNNDNTPLSIFQIVRLMTGIKSAGLDYPSLLIAAKKPY
jgi:hypothetical protein